MKSPPSNAMAHAAQKRVSAADPWAHLRFAIIGPLLAAPPEKGELSIEIHALAKKCWNHPLQGTPLYFSASTLFRWYYAARNSDTPITALGRSRREDAGRSRTLSVIWMEKIKTQHRENPQWSVQLHYDNLLSIYKSEDNKGQPTLEKLPSYSTVRRYMKSHGLHRRSLPKRRTAGAQQAAERLENLEVRSYEADYAFSLWHLDFHHGSLKIVTPQGEWVTPILLGVIDDHSRLICHLQWYLGETTEMLTHGLSQAFQKRGLPRALMTDNGAAMTSDEFCEGLMRMSIIHETTLPYSPYQNAKQESFWATLEGRLMAMLGNVENMTLEFLNEATLAWVEGDYHRTTHQEIKSTPMERYLDSLESTHTKIRRDSPTTEQLKQHFCKSESRKQRRSDGTLTVSGKRFEVPGRYHHLEKVSIRYARWDLSQIQLVDPHNGSFLCWLYPLDKSANANGERRARSHPPDAQSNTDHSPADPLPPLMRQLLEEHAATGHPPAYLPFNPTVTNEKKSKKEKSNG